MCPISKWASFGLKWLTEDFVSIIPFKLPAFLQLGVWVFMDYVPVQYTKNTPYFGKGLRAIWPLPFKRLLNMTFTSQGLSCGQNMCKHYTGKIINLLIELSFFIHIFHSFCLFASQNSFVFLEIIFIFQFYWVIMESGFRSHISALSVIASAALQC